MVASCRDLWANELFRNQLGLRDLKQFQENSIFLLDLQAPNFEQMEQG